MFNSLVHKKKNPTKTRKTGMSSSRPRSCNYKNNGWQCQLANGRTLVVSGQSFIKALRKATGGSKAVRKASLKYPNSGRGQCMLHLTYTNGRTEVVRGRCGGSVKSNPVATPAVIRARPESPTPRPPSGSEPQVMDIGQRCCFDPELMLIVCSDPNNPYNGREVAEIVSLDEASGTAVLKLKPVAMQTTAQTILVKAPLCPDDAGDTPPPEQKLRDCCYDPVTSTLVCDNPAHPAHGLQVQLLELNEAQGLAKVAATVNGVVTHIYAMLCPDKPGDTPPPPPPPKRGDECCYDPVLGKLLCADVTSPLNGADVTLEVINEVNGQAIATVYVGGDPRAGMRVPLCETPECCLDLATSKLLCESDPASPYNGLQVSVEQVGVANARVSHPSLLPYGFAYVPLCETPPEKTGDCCFNQDTMQIICADASNPLHGQTAGIVTEFEMNGVKMASVAWPGGGVRLPLCGDCPPEECPPAYCCINIDTMTFVCPGTPELDGQPADVADIKEVDGFTYAVLSDKTFVPICGADCPPPELCPDGMWRTPTGECAIPECPECPETTCPECPPGQDCPTCPPGMLLDTTTGQCVECPTCPEQPGCPPCPPQQPCPPGGGGSGWTGSEPCCPEPSWWEQAGHCCESCAHGHECEGNCGDDCDCGKDHKHGNPGHSHGHSHAKSSKPPFMGAASWIAAGR